MPHRAPESTPPDASEIERLRRENEQLREHLRRSEAERQRLRRQNEKLKEELDAARRAVYRQAAPLARGVTVATPRVPGRQGGAAYGVRAHRRRPPHIDETYDAALSATCPQCAGPVRATGTAEQYQEELAVQRPVVRAFGLQSAGAGRVTAASRGGIGWRPPMRWTRPRCSLGRRPPSRRR